MWINKKKLRLNTPKGLLRLKSVSALSVFKMSLLEISLIVLNKKIELRRQKNKKDSI